jgi:hypothetical protein
MVAEQFSPVPMILIFENPDETLEIWDKEKVL